MIGGTVGLLAVAVAKALGASPVILTGTRDGRLDMLGADEVINVNREDPVAAVQRITGGKGLQYVLECSGAPNALNEAARMVNRGGRERHLIEDTFNTQKNNGIGLEHVFCAQATASKNYYTLMQVAQILWILTCRDSLQRL